MNFLSPREDRQDRRVSKRRLRRARGSAVDISIVPPLMFFGAVGASGINLTAYAWGGVTDVQPGANQWTNPEPGDVVSLTGGGKAVCPALTIGYAYYGINVVSVPISITAKIRGTQVALPGGGNIGILLRGNAGFTNYFYCTVERAAALNKIKIWQWDGVSETQRATQNLSATNPFTSGEDTLNITDNGSTISCWLNSQPSVIASYASATYAANTYIGPYLFGAGDWVGSSWDDIVAR